MDRYKDMLMYFASCGLIEYYKIGEEYRERLIDPCLKELNKTIEDFNIDIKETNKELNIKMKKDMENYEEHYHCDICSEPHNSKELAQECFSLHNEIETLRWVANSVNNTFRFNKDKLRDLDYILYKNIVNICDRFNIKDEDY